MVQNTTGDEECYSLAFALFYFVPDIACIRVQPLFEFKRDGCSVVHYLHSISTSASVVGAFMDYKRILALVYALF